MGWGTDDLVAGIDHCSPRIATAHPTECTCGIYSSRWSRKGCCMARSSSTCVGGGGMRYAAMWVGSGTKKAQRSSYRLLPMHLPQPSAPPSTDTQVWPVPPARDGSAVAVAAVDALLYESMGYVVGEQIRPQAPISARHRERPDEAHAAGHAGRSVVRRVQRRPARIAANVPSIGASMRTRTYRYGEVGMVTMGTTVTHRAYRLGNAADPGAGVGRGAGVLGDKCLGLLPEEHARWADRA